MAGNTFGHIFRLTSFGESHGKGIGGVIDGCPAGLEIDEPFIQSELSRRKPGQSEITTSRTEDDKFEILSGVFEGQTTGAPIGFLIPNKDQQSKDYEHLKNSFRPSHADFTYEHKYGLRDYRGGGRSSARETAARVFAGAIAKLFLNKSGVSISGFVSQVAHIHLEKSYEELDLSTTESSLVRCPDEETSARMVEEINQAKEDGDTLGGIVSCLIKGTPIGLGEPVFDKLNADLGKAMLSINAVKGFELGSGFAAVTMKGSTHNDIFENNTGKISTRTNFSGGIQGGISNGQDIYFNVAFKPVATVMQSQVSVDKDGKEIELEGKGRHDPCVVPRAVPIVEAMTALVLVDHLLRNKTSRLG